jgi:hypothetical protein
MNSPAFDREQLERLRWVSKAVLPGNLLAAIGFPALFLIPLFMCVLSPFIATPDKNRQPNKGPATANPTSQTAQQGAGTAQQGGGGSPLGTTCLFVLGTPLLWAGGSVALILLRRKLNTNFVEKNTIRLSYSLPHSTKARHKRLLRALDDLRTIEMFKIVKRSDGDYNHQCSVVLRVQLPKYLTCNEDVYSFVIGDDIYYLLPDCLLMYVGGDYYRLRWNNVALRTNNIDRQFRITEYHAVMVHGRIRKDGGLDQRYNTRFQQQARIAWRSTRDYGVLSFTFDNEGAVILAKDRGLVREIGPILQDWIEAH